ncbi:uncharacterized protein LOC128233456 [Mya arenaria]|uniref:uncharacterized protein LOC128233421 n=1 Tax=Mya arenaria TaxID=6604 RepID=UPI0022E0FCA6|nr:uncharacterized protein LOC128233421 [Mya arenaria]XP_052803091.1 uncharacterized protein LOC128233456 [Mya arenaria]
MCVSPCFAATMFSVKTLVLFVAFVIKCCTNGQTESPTCYNKFEYEYHVLEKLLTLEQGELDLSKVIKVFAAKFEEQNRIIDALNASIHERLSDGSTYIRWGRSACPADTGAELIYEGYAAGGHYSHPGAGTNNLCLPRDPQWGQDATTGSRNLIYGTEYETPGTFMSAVHNHDVPCAVCRTPASNVLMIPAKLECHDGWKKEYNGYLMSGYYNYAAAKEYACVDSEPEALDAGHENKNGAMFYLVESVCGALECPPYTNGKELTCVVCTYGS